MHTYKDCELPLLQKFNDPTLDFCMLGSRTTLKPHIWERLEDIPLEKIDASRMFRFCISEHTYPMVAQAFREQHAPALPRPVTITLERMHRHFIQSWLPRRSRICSTADQIGAMLISLGVNFVFLRGQRFSERFYPNPIMRIFGDIDLLIPADTKREVEEALLDLGFTYIRADHFRESQERFIGQLEFRNQDNGVVVDLNWRLTDNGQNGGFSVDMPLLWSRTKQLNGMERQLSNEDTLLHIIRHAAQGHEYERHMIKACMDVSHITFLSSDDFDWDYFIEQAQQSKSLRAVALLEWFYETHYRDSEMPSFSSAPIDILRLIKHGGNKTFVRLNIYPQLKLAASKRKSFHTLLSMNLTSCAKICSAHNTEHFKFLLWKMVIWPNTDILTLLDDERFVRPIWLRRLRLYIMMIFLLPGIVSGCLFFLFFGLGNNLSVKINKSP